MISKETDEQIIFFYKKSFKDMNEVEKEQIEDITLNKKKINGKNTETKISEVIEFPKLKSCVINGFDINENDVMELKKCKELKCIQFSNCKFSSMKSFEGIEELIIDNCEGIKEEMFKQLENLQILQIISNEKFDVKNIKQCKELKRIYIQDTKVKRIEALGNLKKLEYINLNKSTINPISFELLKRNSKAKIVYDKNAEIKVE